MRFITLILSVIIVIQGFGQTVAPIKPKQNRIKIGVIYSPEINYRTLKSNGLDSNNYWLVDFNNSNDRPKFGQTFGVDVLFQLSKSFSIETGVQYTNRGFQTKLTPLTFGDNIDPRKGFMYTTGNNPWLDNTSMKSIYSFYYLDIPVQLNFTAGKRKARFYSSIGLNCSFLLKAETTLYLKSEDEAVRESSETIHGFRPFNLSPTVAMGIDYQYNESLNFRVAPSGKYGLSPIKNSQIAYHLWSIGLSIGAYWQL